MAVAECEDAAADEGPGCAAELDGAPPSVCPLPGNDPPPACADAAFAELAELAAAAAPRASPGALASGSLTLPSLRRQHGRRGQDARIGLGGEHALLRQLVLGEEGHRSTLDPQLVLLEVDAGLAIQSSRIAERT